MPKLLSISANNFLSLQHVEVKLKDLTVLVGPNGAGKSNLLKAIQFLGDTTRLDLGPAILNHGGFDKLFFRGASQRSKSRRISLGIKAIVTKYAGERSPDEYNLTFWQTRLPASLQRKFLTQRKEEFLFKRTQGRGRRITVTGSKVEVSDADGGRGEKGLTMASQSSGLSTLSRLGSDVGADQISKLADLFQTFRVFEINTAKARDPVFVKMTSQGAGDRENLASDASNLAAFLIWLKDKHEETFDLLERDFCGIVPTVKRLVLKTIDVSGTPATAVALEEKGLAGETFLRDASFGSVRALALLAMLHDPTPPLLSCVEEIDHGLHPHALDIIVDRLRTASRKTQLLVATHSPALVNRLDASELVVCERDVATGGSLIPAIESEIVANKVELSGLLPGELWFSGALGGSLAQR